MSAMGQLEALLRERTGLDAAAVGPGAVERAVRARMAALKLDELAAYRTVLQDRPDEFQALIEAVVVSETWFFRHADALAALGRFAATRVFGPAAGDRTPPSAANAAEHRRLRLLSIPCSTGEEPYSMTMALFDAGIPPERFVVDAVDISARALDHARRGVYGANAFRGRALAYRERYFQRAGHGHAIADKVRQQVRLASGNLLDPALLAGEAPYDFIFCRNLLIYFDPATQKRALQALRRLLRGDGMLFVGPAETHLTTRGGFVSAGVPLAFAFRPPADAATPRRAPAPARPARPQAPTPARQHARRPTPVAPALTTSAGKPGIDGIVRLADQGRTDEALAACQAMLREQGPSAPAYCLLGVLYDARHQPRAARDAYRRALYLDPGHQDALLHLAALLETDGDHAGAERLRQRARRAQGARHG